MAILANEKQKIIREGREGARRKSKAKEASVCLHFLSLLRVPSRPSRIRL
jgi:hypothetical protein